jgi:hypothetical protein
MVEKGCRGAGFVGRGADRRADAAIGPGHASSGYTDRTRAGRAAVVGEPGGRGRVDTIHRHAAGCACHDCQRAAGELSVGRSDCNGTSGRCDAQRDERSKRRCCVRHTEHHVAGQQPDDNAGRIDSAWNGWSV